MKICIMFGFTLIIILITLQSRKTDWRNDGKSNR